MPFPPQFAARPQMQQPMQQRQPMMPMQNRMQAPMRNQQFAPQMGQLPLPNPTAAPPMLQPAGMSQLGPQQGMPYGQPPMGQSAQQNLGQLTQKYAEGDQVQMPDPNAWRPPMNTLGQMPPSMQMQPPMMPMAQPANTPQGMPQGMPQMPQGMPQGMPPMAAQGAAPTGLMPQGGAGMPQRFANGGPVSAQDQLGGTQIAKRYAQGGKANHLANTDADDQVMQALSRDPQFDALINQGHDELGDMPIEALNEFISMIRMALRHPEKYPEIRMAAIRDNMVEPDDMPEQFDAQMLVSMLTTLVALKKKQEGKTAKTQKLATGGLAKAAAQLQKKGRNGDTILAHINPQEAAMLRAQGGTGTINPATGLVEYGFWKKLWKGIKSVAKFVAPIALSFLAPGVGTWIGSTFLGGLSATAAGVVGGALGGGLMGAAGAAITGGNIGTGALLGGALGGLQYGKVAEGITKSRDATAAAKAATAAGQPSLMAAEAAKDASLHGVVDPATGQRLMPNIAPAPGHVSPDMIPGNMSSGYVPRVDVAADAASAASSATPASTAVANAANAATGAAATPAVAKTFTDRLISGAGNLGGEVLKTGALMAATGALGGGGAPADVMPEVQKLSASQQEYFNRPNVQWDWDRIKSDASSTGMSLSEFMNQNWGAISGGNYNKAETNFASDQAKTQNAARGGRSRATSGALSKVAYLAQGSGSGRADTIDAKLSDGEYVIDAETVALLGDGSTKEGARRLDMMRQQLRQQKGKQLSRGKFSTSAKMPLSYVKGAR